MQTEVAEGLAVAVLTAIAAEPEKLGRFVAITGLQPELARDAAADLPSSLACWTVSDVVRPLPGRAPALRR
jgi:hypothetical protein